ncbi:molybdopterin-dependent oxidoreductase [Nocardia sp. alder85J]|uniref:molybdopterin-dependent oxidoreductase n=1 Tax=Nocardia sp. alder85J TaxID=2862949 RepID=UPI001CD5D716|nr:molybdopterin-dependent oxidoreductase [Nocardia sp. alder85J]MCX4099057.1 molybdopterin-dependent oxidoreductase [Nocardia sp. alder85J]
MTGLRVALGIVSAGTILGVAELVSVPVGPNSAPLDAVGSAVVDNTPQGLREWVIGTFGTNDKLVLYVVMILVAVGVAAAGGSWERRGRPYGSALFVVFGVVGVVAACTRAHAGWTAALPTVIGCGCGLLVLRWLVRHADAVVVSDGEKPAVPVESARRGRRRFLGELAGVGALALAGGVAGRLLALRAGDVSGDRAAVRLPAPAEPAAPVPAAVEAPVPGLPSFVTSNSGFYRVDTALSVPQLSTGDWMLRIHGMVDREITLSYADLAARRPIERVMTMTCVSNPVGGNLIGTARWLGYRVADLLAEAGVRPGADMVLSTSVDDFTAGTPLAALTDGRDAMLAIGMNGEPLPVPHGFPARLVVPGLYGYLSATKWVVDLEVTRFDRARGYWARRGWAVSGPIKTEARIDVPKSAAALAPGPVAVAGIAWAQHRGVTAVEVQIDDGDWKPAELSAEYSIDTWRQWVYRWDATPGKHTVRARATDGTGVVQTAENRGTVPDGASGYPAISVRVG